MEALRWSWREVEIHRDNRVIGEGVMGGGWLVWKPTNSRRIKLTTQDDPGGQVAHFYCADSFEDVQRWLESCPPELHRRYDNFNKIVTAYNRALRMFLDPPLQAPNINEFALAALDEIARLSQKPDLSLTCLRMVEHPMSAMECSRYTKALWNDHDFWRQFAISRYAEHVGTPHIQELAHRWRRIRDCLDDGKRATCNMHDRYFGVARDTLRQLGLAIVALESERCGVSAEEIKTWANQPMPRRRQTWRPV